ncbi:MAG TPA: prolyl oligopeptidase family serine peptidase, partial [Gemmatimonadaceae bacterium]|nr:prolyl oligopeptidase family serine peptidase [Gemmatimonadaceae bacterium]
MNRSIATLLLATAVVSTASAQTRPLVTPKDYGKWELLGATRLSPRGDWVALNVNRVDEENQLRIRGGPRDTTIIVTYGSAPAFTADGKWVVYTIGVAPKERERLTREKKPIRNSVELRNLVTGQTVPVADISSWSISPDGRFVALTRYAAEGKRTSDVLVHDLSSGTRLSFANVGEQAWADAGSLLALTIETDGGVGNGVQIYDGVSGTVRALESSPSQYRGLAWRPRSTDLAALRSRVEKEFKDTAYVLLAWQNARSGVPQARQLEQSAIPAGMRIADYRRPSWSSDGRLIYFGVRKREPVADALKKSEEKVSDVEVWHPNDVRMLPQQKNQEAADLRRTLLTAWNLRDNRVVAIGTDLLETSTPLEGGRYATEIDRKPYAWGQKFGRFDQDVYVTDLATGERKRVLEKVRHYFGPNPTGTKLAWADGKDFWVVDLPTGRRANVTAGLEADFVDHDDDHPNNVPPVISPAGWTKDGQTLLLNDAHDVWAVAADGSGGRKLTDGAREGVVHRLVNFAPFTASPVERAYDFAQPQYFSLVGKKTKQSGYARRSPSGSVERLVLADAAHGVLSRADSVPVFAYTRQRYDESPNVYVGRELATAKRMSETNPFQKDYAWGKVELFDYRSTIGVPLQALLYYPANYDPSKKYPLIVYTYERLTQGLHRYIAPRETDYYNTTAWTQNGYFVMMPDIVFRPREPGLGTLYSVEAAVRNVIDRGLVDSAKVGHIGHSQGGYEAAYLGTHSRMFATTVAGSGITDMISFAGQLHWQGGTAEFDHWETGQFRMEVPPWEDFKAMLDNSPLNKVHVMPAKSMLLEVGSEDGVVDSRQGSLFYNYARRAGKHVVMLMYPGEGHGLAKKENQVDYHRRINQWFDHYLKGNPPAKWITDGQSAL